MNMIYEHQCYKTFLKNALAEKVTKNPQFSLRAFATQLGVSHSTLSQVFNGEKNFSFERAMQVASKLQLGDKEKEYFCLLVQYETTKNAEIKSEIRDRLNKSRPSGVIHNLELDTFKIISNWYHFAILALIRLDQELTPNIIAEKLGIQAHEAQLAIERLIRVELIEELSPHRYIRTKNRLMAQGTSAHSGMINFNKQMIQKSLDSIEEQDTSQRVTGSETFIMNPESLEEAKKITNDFLNKMADLTAQCRRGETGEVYHVHVNCFQLNKTNKRRKKYELN